MAEMKDSHVVVIPADDECHHQEQDLAAHPLQEISQSPGHLLLLKLWQREEDLFTRRIAIKETRIDNIRREIFKLCCLFFVFNGLFLTLLFVSSNNSNENGTCRNWWAPCFLYLITCLVVILCVQYKICRYLKMVSQLQRERGNSRALGRSIQELRMKGASFDLSKETPSSVKKVKSSSIEIKWSLLRWCSQNLVTICLLCVTGLGFPSCRYILCS